MKKTTYIFITFLSIGLSLNLNGAVIDEENENGSSINQILRTSHYWGKSFIEYFLSNATQNDIESLKLCRNKELIKYIDDFFEDYKDSYGKKGSIPTILAWKWFGVKQSIELQGHIDYINSVAISHDSSFIVTGSDDETVKIWDIETGKLIKTLECPNSYVILTGLSHNRPDICTMTFKVIKLLNNHPRRIYIIHSLVISHDAKFIVIALNDNTVNIWDSKTGKLINILKVYEGCVRSLAISHDNKFIVTCSNDKTAKIWNRETGKLIKTLKGHTSWINSVAISHDDSFIVTGSNDKTAKIWDRVTGELIKTLRGHDKRVSSVAISYNDRFIITSSSDTARIWSIK